MTPEELKEITNHFLIAKLESDLRIEIMKELVPSEYFNKEAESMIVISELKRQLKELKGL